MVYWLWAAVCILAALVIVLFVKIHLMQKAAREIEAAFADRLMTDTNTLIDISGGDRHMRHLANAINRQLRILRDKRRRYQQGDEELKNAITNISHDLRTPLTAVFGYLDLLEQEQKSEAVERYIGIIKNRCEMLKQLTEELFRYSVILSKENDISREPVVINNVLEESIAAFYTALKEQNIVPAIQMPDTKVIRLLDASALSRIFSNLLQNAMKYSDGDLDVMLSESGEITFANTATRLSEIETGRLFDRFFTVEAARKSTGLGLAITKTLVEQMDGSISAKYESSRLSIRISFPDNT